MAIIRAVRGVMSIVAVGLVTACSGDQFMDADRKLMRLGDEIVAKGERFRETEHRLPRDLAELKEEEGPLYYAMDEDHYAVWFGGKRLGESVKYDSRERRWRFSD